MPTQEDEIARPRINRQAVLSQPGVAYKVVDGVVPQPGPTQALIRLTHSGCCFTDTRSRFAELSESQGPPRVGGHEGIGEVVALGDKVDQSNITIGSRVGMGFLSQTCGTCQLCTTGDEAYCQKQVSTGFKCHGTFQQFAVFEADYLITIPDGLDSATSAPLMCAGATVYSALKAADILPGQWIVIPGSGGGLGHIAIQYAVAMGGQVIGIDSDDEDTKRYISWECGADQYLDHRTQPDIVAAVDDITQGGADVVMVTGMQAYPDAFKYVRPRGTVICLAMGKTELDTRLAVIKGLKIIGSSTSSRAEMGEALEMALQHGIKAKVEIRSLWDVERTMWDLRDGNIAGRVVIDLWD